MKTMVTRAEWPWLLYMCDLQTENQICYVHLCFKSTKRNKKQKKNTDFCLEEHGKRWFTASIVQFVSLFVTLPNPNSARLNLMSYYWTSNIY